MGPSEGAVLLDDQIAPRILEIIRTAQKYVRVVTPYLKFEGWQHSQTAVQEAVRRGVDITFIVRSDDGQMESKDVEWLLGNRVRVLAREHLHAKIYLNEKTCIVSSMNFHASSAMNSLEIALVVKDPEDDRRVREYVSNLMKLARFGDLAAERMALSAAPTAAGYAVRGPMGA